MKKDIFALELIKSGPFRLLVLLILLIFLAVYISRCNEKKVLMKEDVLYIHPKPSV